ncbi:MAG: hypothetical protein K2P74_11255 [Nitrosomonas sp.]|nr:hypothetical protein [Nitrosomonas sp.]
MNKVGDERFKKTTHYTISELLQDYDNFCVLLLNLTLQHAYRLFIVSGSLGMRKMIMRYVLAI